jgi:hypothetical protein
MVRPEEIAVVVHTCPARRDKLEPLKKSLAESDATCVVWEEEPEGATNFEARLHYLDLLCRAARRAPYVLRLEDDIIVNKHLLHNLCTWPALRDEYFGMGLAFVNRLLYEEPHNYDNHTNQYGVYRNPASTPWAQAHFFKSLPLRSAVESYWQLLYEKRGLGARCENMSLAFDWAITQAMGDRGYRVYLHQPSLADCTEVADVRVSGAIIRVPHRARDFDPDWKRDMFWS